MEYVVHGTSLTLPGIGPILLQEVFRHNMDILELLQLQHQALQDLVYVRRVAVSLYNIPVLLQKVERL